MAITGTTAYESIALRRKRLDMAQEAIDSYSAEELEKPIWEVAHNPSDFFLICSWASAQKKSKDIEYYLCRLLDLEYVDASEDRGDGHDGDDYYELKTSTTNEDRDLNIRQIRLWQDIKYYICCYIDEFDLSNSWCFKLTKAEMEAEVAAHGSYTHGTKAAVALNENKEYSLTIGPRKAKEWREKYWFEELYQKLCGTDGQDGDGGADAETDADKTDETDGE